jgi:hypothetical protein
VTVVSGGFLQSVESRARMESSADVGPYWKHQGSAAESFAKILTAA